MKFKPGPLAGELSGSLGDTVASHNRYGAYMRSRVIPVNPNTIPQQRSRGYLATASANWRTLDVPTRASWANFATQNPIVDRLGAKQNLSGNAAYVMLAARRLLFDNTLPTAAPATAGPSGLTALSLEADTGAGDFQITYTPTPAGTANTLYIRGCVLSSPTILFVKPRFKFLAFSALNAASPLDVETMIVAVFGTLTPGQIVYLQVAIYSSLTNLLSLPLQCSATIVHT
jgi:hypothetical protein